MKSPYIKIGSDKSKLLEWINVSGHLISQVKYDGMYCCIEYDGVDRVRLSSRAGIEIPQTHLGYLLSEVDSLKNLGQGQSCYFIGELVFCDLDGVMLDRATSNGLLNRISKGG